MGHQQVKKLTPSTRQEFERHLLRDVAALDRMLDANLFEAGIERIGAEQEFCFVDKSWRPAPIIMEFLERVDDPHFTTEYARFNAEVNLDPVELTGNCFRQLETTLNDFLMRASETANLLGADIILIGILPTISRSDLEISNLTPLERYRLLADALHDLRGESFEFRIRGMDELLGKQESIMFESCNTSFQVHLQVHPSNFISMYNWAQAMAGPVLAASTNSSLLLGKRLWHETRIALFQQSTDVRGSNLQLRDATPRVTLGTTWLKDSISNVFKEEITRHRAILGADFSEDPLEALDAGKIPRLKAMNIHNGTVWKWNRACYGITDGKPHLRIENRVLPAGPTIVDEVANAAFWIGLMKGQPKEYVEIERRLDFDEVRNNFLKAARLGLGAQFHWVDDREIDAPDFLLEELLPLARRGLQKAGIDGADIDHYLGIVQERIRRRRTGSKWLIESFTKLAHECERSEAVVGVTAGVRARQNTGQPVHEWTLAEASEAGGWQNRFWRVEQVMTTNLITAREDDLVDFVARIMIWNNIRHVPIEDNQGRLLGLVTSGRLLDYYSESKEEADRAAPVSEIMVKSPTTINPEECLPEALRQMMSQGIGCLPVCRGERLVGILTEHDAARVLLEVLDELGSEDAQ